MRAIADSVGMFFVGLSIVVAVFCIILALWALFRYRNSSLQMTKKEPPPRGIDNFFLK